MTPSPMLPSPPSMKRLLKRTTSSPTTPQRPPRSLLRKSHSQECHRPSDLIPSPPDKGKGKAQDEPPKEQDSDLPHTSPFPIFPKSRPHSAPHPRLSTLPEHATPPDRASLPAEPTDTQVVLSHTSQYKHSGSWPPPQPPTILIPPLPCREPRSGRPYEGFLDRGQPSGECEIQLESTDTEYNLLVNLPGFDSNAITLSTRRRHALHIVADSWENGAGHFERRINFGYDADLSTVRASFDGQKLNVVIPRRRSWLS